MDVVPSSGFLHTILLGHRLHGVKLKARIKGPERGKLDPSVWYMDLSTSSQTMVRRTAWQDSRFCL